MSYMKRLQKNNRYFLLEMLQGPCYYNGAGKFFFFLSIRDIKSLAGTFYVQLKGTAENEKNDKSAKSIIT